MEDNTKLVSGYTVNEKLSDGTPVIKPEGKLKCSHGGLFDNSSFIPSVGGINKDSSFYIISPRADLHAIAARLAINHTEYFFDLIRENVGDERFESYLRLNENEKGGIFYTTCGANISKKTIYSTEFISFTSLVIIIKHFLN